jgi:hypothetical protein
MIIESLIAATTVIIVASLKYTNSIVNGDKREARKFEAEEAEKDRQIDLTIKKEELAAIEKERQAAVDEQDRLDPAMCKAKRLAIAEKRKLIMFERDRYVDVYDRRVDVKEVRQGWWHQIVEYNKKLSELAEEEAKIPVLEGTEEFDVRMKELEAKEVSLQILSKKVSAKMLEEEKDKTDIPSKRGALFQERNLMEKIALDGTWETERGEARDRIKEITEELGKL